jgi:uncharacterized phiE125 gp8 family phage protein
MERVIVSPPASEPITLADAKAWARIDDDVDDIEDAKINGLILAARSWTENFLNRALITQTWDVYGDEFADPLEMPLAPMQSVTWVKYLDTDGALQTLSADTYDVDTVSFAGAVRLAYGQAWPSIQPVANAVRVRIVAGYGGPDDVPEPIRLALRMLVAHWYDTPGGEPPSAVGSLLWPYRVMTF